MMPGTGSGMGPQSGGFWPTDSERAKAMRRDVNEQGLQERILMHSNDMQRIQRSVVDPWQGGSQAGTNWMYNSMPGYLFQQMAGAAVTRGMLGNGNPLGMSYGIQQMIGRTGAGFMDVSGGGGVAGVSRTFGGAGFVTNQVTEQMFKGLQDRFYGPRGNLNMVSGMNQDQVGVLMAELGTRRAFAGEQVGTFKQANLAERLAHYQKIGNKRIAGELKGVTTTEDLDRKLEQATRTGDTQLRDAIKQVNSSSTIFEMDQKFQDNTEKLVKSTASMVTTLGDIMGSNDIPEMMRMAERFAGHAVKTVADAKKVERQVNDAVVFAESQGINGRDFLNEMTAQGQAAQVFFQQRYGLDPADTARMASAIGKEATMMGMMSVSGQGQWQNATAGESASMAGAGMMRRLMENPQLVAAARALRIGNLSGEQQGQLRGMLDQFRSATTGDARDNVRARIDQFFQGTYGRGALSWMGKDGFASALRDDQIVADTQGVLGSQVSNSVANRSSVLAYNQLSSAQRGVLKSARPFQILAASFTPATQDKLLKLMSEGNSDEVRKFLESRAGTLVDTEGNKVAAGDLMTALGPDLKGAAGALGTMAAAFRMDPHTRAVISSEGRQEAAGTMMQKMLGGSRGMGWRTAGKSFRDALVAGLLGDANGELAPAEIAGLAREADPSKSFTVAMDGSRMKLDSMAQLEAMTKGKDTRDLLRTAGVKDLAGLYKALQDKGEAGSAATAALFGFARDNYAVNAIDEKLVFTDQDYFDKVRTDQSMLAKRNRLSFLTGLDASKFAEGMSNVEAGSLARQQMESLVTEDGKTTSLLEKVAGGDTESILRMQEVDKMLGGELTASLDEQIGNMQKRLKDKNYGEGQDQSKVEKQLERLQKAKDQLSADQTRVMRVENLIVANYQNAPSEKG